MKRDRAKLEMFILDVMRHDAAENVESIIRMLNNRGCIGWRDQWPSDFHRDEVDDTIAHLVKVGDVRVLVEDIERGVLVPALPSVTVGRDLWYSLTASGRLRWEQWTAPT
jgi:hypothetical protein